MNELSKNMDNFFNNLIDTMPNISNSGNKIYTKNTSNFYKEYVEHNILLLFLLTILIIIIITYFYWNNDIEKNSKNIENNIEKNINNFQDIIEEKDNKDFINNIDKETLLDIIDELSSVNEKQYELQQKLKEKEKHYENLKNNFGNKNNNYENYKNINNTDISNIDGIYIETPYTKNN